MDYPEAVITVLREEGRPLHWTVIQDLALKRGYLDPFTQRDIRRNVLAALNAAVRKGEVLKEGKGTYRLANGEPSSITGPAP